MTWVRPIPTVGDPTSAAERAGDPKGWSMGTEAVEGFARLVAARRDIRRFRPDPVVPEVLRRVLEAAHAAPSVGHSQPWRFVLVEDRVTRQRAATLADRAILDALGGPEVAPSRRSPRSAHPPAAGEPASSAKR